MNKKTLLEIILGTIGGITLSLGMCMCLIAEWNLFKAGVITFLAGFIILLCIIPIYRSNRPKKNHKDINLKIIIPILIGVIGVLIMGFGMSKVMIEEVSNKDMIIGIITGIIGLIICILNYPIYSYLKENQFNK